MEIIRRLALIAGVFGAIWCAATPEPRLVEINSPDFAKMQRKRLRFQEGNPIPLQDFIAKQTEGRLLPVQGQAWQALAEASGSLAAGQEVPAGWRHRIGRSYADKSLFFHPQEPPVEESVARLSAMESFAYLRIDGAHGPQYLTAGLRGPSDTIGKAPSAMLYPWRGYAIWTLLAGLAMYALLPRRRCGSECLRYSLLPSAVLPDLMGAMLAGVFFTIPLLVIPANSSTGDLFEEGWGILTIVSWGMLAFPLAIFAAAAWYSSLRIDLLDDRFRRTTLWGTRDFPYADIASASIVERRAPRWLSRLGFFVSLLNWRALGPTLLATSRSAPALEIACRDGSHTTILLEALPEADRLLEALTEHNVPAPAGIPRDSTAASDPEGEP